MTALLPGVRDKRFALLCEEKLLKLLKTSPKAATNKVRCFREAADVHECQKRTQPKYLSVYKVVYTNTP